MSWEGRRRWTWAPEERSEEQLDAGKIGEERLEAGLWNEEQLGVELGGEVDEEQLDNVWNL